MSCVLAPKTGSILANQRHNPLWVHTLGCGIRTDSVVGNQETTALLLPYAGTTRIRFKGFHLRPALFRLAAPDMGLSSSQSSPRNGSMVGEVETKVKDNLESTR